MKFSMLIVLLSLSFLSISQVDIKLEKKVKRFEYAIRDLQRLGFNNDFKKSDALNFVISTKDSLAQNCPIVLQIDTITIDQTKLINWINTNDSEYQQFISFLEVYIRKNI